jgi:hypothetical protein
MSTAAFVLAALALLLGTVAVVVLARRAARAERQIRRLESDVDDLRARLGEVSGDARAASMTARRAAAAVGVDEPARVPLEAVTGKVVKAVAFSAGARRAIARLADPRSLRRSA